jgi:mitochondrial inner membrane protease subunit 1
VEGMGGKLIRVPKGHVWIEGDNVVNSIDSRDYGPVPEATLKGRVLARVSTSKNDFDE